MSAPVIGTGCFCWPWPGAVGGTRATWVTDRRRRIGMTWVMMMMMMMRGFVERVINSPQTRCQSAKQVGLQMSSERQWEESCSSQSGW